MTPTESRKQYEITVSTNGIREAITKLSAHLCDLVEQALIDEDANEFDTEFDQYCQDLRLVLANRPDDPGPSPYTAWSSEADDTLDLGEQ